MPILPEGSSYIGLDKSEPLIKEAEINFANSKYKTDFRLVDISDYESDTLYDVVICQTVLVHNPNPKAILLKMVNSVKYDGIVICIEPNWNISAYVSTYIDGLSKYSLHDFGLYQKNLTTNFQVPE